MNDLNSELNNVSCQCSVTSIFLQIQIGLYRTRKVTQIDSGTYVTGYLSLLTTLLKYNFTLVIYWSIVNKLLFCWWPVCHVTHALSSIRQYLSWGACLEVNMEDNQNCCAVLCMTVLHSDTHTQMSSSYSSQDWVLSQWVHFTVRIVGMVGWAWWDWSLVLRTYLPSVLWHCWLGYLTCKNPSPIWPIYNVFGETLNLAPLDESCIMCHRQHLRGRLVSLTLWLQTPKHTHLLTYWGKFVCSITLGPISIFHFILWFELRSVALSFCIYYKYWSHIRQVSDRKPWFLDWTANECWPNNKR